MTYYWTQFDHLGSTPLRVHVHILKQTPFLLSLHVYSNSDSQRSGQHVFSLQDVPRQTLLLIWSPQRIT